MGAMARLSSYLDAWTPVAVVLSLAIATTWLYYLVQDGVLSEHPVRVHETDLVMQSVQSQQMNDQGRLHYALKAQQMQHYADDDSSLYQQVWFTEYPDKGLPINIIADRAIRLGVEDQVVFLGHVVLTQPQPKGMKPLIINTPQLIVFVSSGVGIATYPVKAQQEGTIIEAQTMLFNREAQRVELTHAHILYPTPASPHF
jgi:LPS export ABC transporter protein LptC